MGVRGRIIIISNEFLSSSSFLCPRTMSSITIILPKVVLWHPHSHRHPHLSLYGTPKLNPSPFAAQCSSAFPSIAIYKLQLLLLLLLPHDDSSNTSFRSARHFSCLQVGHLHSRSCVVRVRAQVRCNVARRYVSHGVRWWVEIRRRTTPITPRGCWWWK